MSRSQWMLSVVVVAALAAGALYWVKRSKPLPVQLTEVDRGDVERTVTNTRAGTLNACRRAELSPAFGGQIANLPVREGEAVTRGQVLFEIWNLDRRAQVELARAELSASQALRQQTCIQAELAKTDARRLTRLKDQGLASEESADKAVSLERSGRAACEAATATVGVSRARLTVAEAALDKTILTAPFDGTVAEVNGELGEYVTPSPVGIPTPPAIDLIDTSCLYVRAPIDEVDAPEIRAGMSARISLDAFGRRYFDGRVRRVAPYVLDVEKQARTVDIEVDFLTRSDSDDMLPGYTADIEVILDAHADTLRIPTEVLLEGNRVYLYDPDFGTVSDTVVRTGLSNWRHTEVLDGLQQGQQIVITIDRDGLVDGAAVKIETR